MSLAIVVLAQCEREIEEFPIEVIEDLLDAVARLRKGESLSMPLSKALGSVQKNLYELRLKDKGGIYRIFYFIKLNHAIYLIHAYKKKSQKIPMGNLETVKNRLRNLK